MSATYWLIEYRENGATVGYLKDMRRGDGGLDVQMTFDSSKAQRFTNKWSAQSLIDDWAFQRTVPFADQLYTEEHMDMDGPDLAAPETDSKEGR